MRKRRCVIIAKKTERPSPTALLNPRCDASFKAMFTLDTEESNAALKDFISTLLDRPVEKLWLMPNEPAVDVIDENQMSFDVSVKFNDGEMVDIEMQSRLQNYDYASRAEIQVARLLSTMNKKGDNWNTASAFQISVLNFEFDKDDDSALSWYSMRKNNGGELSGKLNVIFFDLIKIHNLLGKPLDELSKLEKWGLFLSYADDERYSKYIDQLVKSEEGIMNAKSSLCTVSQDEINWVRQNSIFIAQRDRNTIIQNSIKEGLEKGLEQGYKNKAIEVAKNLISMQLGTFEQIAAVAGLSVEEVRSLAENS
ncbi:MAG: Rpn family recombination-promoting nuclease/putative transposase [Treponema sp.]|nr:Rpn family recombination-promoting nuclease/putative transposase [Treponema sp.]